MNFTLFRALWLMQSSIPLVTPVKDVVTRGPQGFLTICVHGRTLKERSPGLPCRLRTWAAPEPARQEENGKKTTQPLRAGWSADARGRQRRAAEAGGLAAMVRHVVVALRRVRGNCGCWMTA